MAPILQTRSTHDNNQRGLGLIIGIVVCLIIWSIVGHFRGSADKLKATKKLLEDERSNVKDKDQLIKDQETATEELERRLENAIVEIQQLKEDHEQRLASQEEMFSTKYGAEIAGLEARINQSETRAQQAVDEKLQQEQMHRLLQRKFDFINQKHAALIQERDSRSQTDEVRREGAHYFEDGCLPKSD